MSQHLISTQVLASTCRRCGVMILSGLAEGLHAHVDLGQLDRAGEIAALLAGRWTYTLHSGELIYRDITRIAGNSISGPVLAAHRCKTEERI